MIPPLKAIALSLILIIGQVAAIKFEKGELLIWTLTDHYVDLGVAYYDIECKYTNPCKILEDIYDGKEERSKYKYTKITTNRLVKLCNEDYNNKWFPKLEAFAKCEKEKLATFERVKRFVLFLVIAVIAVITVVSAIVATTVMMNVEIDTVNASLVHTNEEMSLLREKINTQYDMNGRTVKGLETLIKDVGHVTSSLETYANTMAETQWRSGKVQIQFDKSKQALDSLRESCTDGKIDTNALAQLLNIQSLRRIERSETQIQSIQRLDHGTIGLKFLAPIIAEDAKIFRVQPFKHYVNLTTAPTVIDYVGPRLVIHNTTCNCTKGVESDGWKVHDTCMTTGCTDLRLELRGKVDWDGDLQPQVIQTQRSTHVHCIYHNITLQNRAYSCPPHVIKFPILQSFQAGPALHQINVTRQDVTDALEVPPIKQLNQSLVIEDIEDQMKLIHSIKELNEQLNNGKLAYRLGPESWKNVEFWTSLGIPVLSLSLTILFCLVKLMLCLSPRRRGPDDHHESVMVVNNIQKPNEEEVEDEVKKALFNYVFSQYIPKDNMKRSRLRGWGC